MFKITNDPASKKIAKKHTSTHPLRQMLVCFYDMFFRQSAAASEEAAEPEADAHGKEEQGLAEGGLSAIAMDSTSAARNPPKPLTCGARRCRLLVIGGNKLRRRCPRQTAPER